MANFGRLSKLIVTSLLLVLKLCSNEVYCDNVVFARAENGYQYHPYQKGIFCNSTYSPIAPTFLSEIQLIVQQAYRQNVTLKALGHLHSITDVICTTGVPLNMEKINHFSYDPETGLARVGAGARVHQLTKDLDLVGRALEGMPAYADISVGGAIATGAHGSSLTRLTTISSQIVGLTVVDGRGNIVEISEESDKEAMNAFRVNLGLLGIIYDVTIRTVPQYKVHTENVAVSETTLFKNIEQLVEDARNTTFLQFYWFPSAEQVVLSKSNVVSVNTSGDCETHLIPEVTAREASFFKGYLELMHEYKLDLGFYLLQWYCLKSLVTSVFGKTPLFTDGDSKNGEFCSPAVGYSHKMLANKCNECVWDQGADSLSFDESEVVIPLTELEPAIETIRSILKSYPTEFYFTGILFRFLKPVSGLLAIDRGRESVGIEWVLTARENRFKIAKTGFGSMQAIVQALIHKHQGRTHWGKNGVYFSSPEMITLQHGKHREQFAKQMEKWDPNGTFMNEIGRRVRFLEEDFGAFSFEHCALHDACICKTDRDCGEEGISCSQLNGFPVCLPEHNRFVKFLVRINRLAILCIQVAFEQLWSIFLLTFYTVAFFQLLYLAKLSPFIVT